MALVWFSLFYSVTGSKFDYFNQNTIWINQSNGHRDGRPDLLHVEQASYSILINLTSIPIAKPSFFQKIKSQIEISIFNFEEVENPKPNTSEVPPSDPDQTVGAETRHILLGSIRSSKNKGRDQADRSFESCPKAPLKNTSFLAVTETRTLHGTFRQRVPIHNGSIPIDSHCEEVPWNAREVF